MPGASGLAHLARRREGLQVKQLCRDAETDFGQNSYARTQERISGKAAMPGHISGTQAKFSCLDSRMVSAKGQEYCACMVRRAIPHESGICRVLVYLAPHCLLEQILANKM